MITNAPSADLHNRIIRQPCVPAEAGSKSCHSDPSWYGMSRGASTGSHPAIQWAMRICSSAAARTRRVNPPKIASTNAAMSVATAGRSSRFKRCKVILGLRQESAYLSLSQDPSLVSAPSLNRQYNHPVRHLHERLCGRDSQGSLGPILPSDGNGP